MASSDIPKLFYFDSPGLALVSRLIFTYTDDKFEDVRFSREEWDTKYKAEAPLGMAPYYEEGGVKFGGSLAIARYAGEKYGLGGSNPLENAQLGSYADVLLDIGTKLWAAKLGPEDEREECKAEFLKTTPAKFSLIEKQMKGKDSFLESKVSWADIMLYTICSYIIGLELHEVFKDCNKVKAIIDKISANERIKAYIAKHPPTVPKP